MLVLVSIPAIPDGIDDAINVMSFLQDTTVYPFNIKFQFTLVSTL